MEPMDEETAWATIAAERRALADLLEGLTPEQWATPSLCEAWTVREVATHMMVGPTGSLPSFLTAMIAARGRFAKANQVMVGRKIARPTDAVVADFRDFADHRFHPPGMDWHAPLADLLIHRLDVVVPLGIDHGRPAEPWADALTYVLGPKGRTSFVDAGLPALSYAATDLDWSHGDAGPRVEGPIEALALAVTRRPVRLEQLGGDGAETLRAWAGSG